MENWPKTCPSGYSQHLLLVNDGCELNYCVVMNALTPRALPSIRKPPYDNEPKILHNGTKLLVAANEAILVKDRRSGEWVDSGRKTGMSVLDLCCKRRQVSSAETPSRKN